MSRRIRLRVAGLVFELLFMENANGVSSGVGDDEERQEGSKSSCCLN
jgi:hypothetical protein